MRVLRSAEVLLQRKAGDVQQTAEYSVQAEFGLLAASLCRLLDAGTAAQHRILQELTIGKLTIRNKVHSLSVIIGQPPCPWCLVVHTQDYFQILFIKFALVV